MRPRALAAVPALCVLALCAHAAHAELVSRSGRFAGAEIDYRVVLPPGYDSARAYPMVLVFTGGGQEIEAAQNTLEIDWRAEAEKRGYIVVSPAAPGGDLFFEGGDRVFPAFLDAMRKTYNVAGKIHIAGHSNGGLSAFHIAARYPAYFSTVTGYPGLLQDPKAEPMAPLKPLCLYMHVGERDAEWRQAMQQQSQQMAAEGYRIRLTVEKNQSHRLKAPELDLSRRLFDEIESCR
jgi:poly(3-hydroxybutyrate) depolymerase